MLRRGGRRLPVYQNEKDCLLRLGIYMNINAICLVADLPEQRPRSNPLESTTAD